MSEERTVKTPFVGHELDEIRARQIALGEWYGPRDSYLPGADLPSLVSLAKRDLVDAASVYLKMKDFPEGIADMELQYQMADKLKQRISELASLADALERYRTNWSAFSKIDRFSISLNYFFATGEQQEAESMLQQFDSQVSETILLSDEIKALMENAHRSFRKRPNRPTDYPFHNFARELIHIGMGIALHDPSYGKTDQVSGPWIDYLLSAIKPLRPHTTPSAVANEIDTWRRRQARQLTPNFPS